MKTNTFSYIQRNFCEKSHLELFKSGTIRLGFAEFYRTINDSNRRNPRDGFFKGYITGGEKPGFYTSQRLTFSYILSFSLPQTNKISGAYGESAVQIRNYVILFERLANAFNTSNLHNYIHGQVEYKESIDRKPTWQDEYFLNASTHAKNREYRFLFQLKDINPKNFKKNVHFSRETTRCAASIYIPSFVTISGLQISDLIV